MAEHFFSRIGTSRSPDIFQRLDEIKQDIIASVARNSQVIGTRNPMIGVAPGDYRWEYHDEYFWADSFWTGQLWLAYQITGSPEFKNMARMRVPHLERILETPLFLSHDLGFLFSLSCVADYRLTRNEHARALALRAADALRNRFNHVGEYLVAWTPGFREHRDQCQARIIIDCMQNLALLNWAYSETAIESYRAVAEAQAETSLRFLVRDDWSTYHAFDFDTFSNEPRNGLTVQGFSDDSCWSRGQAWAIHGFAQLAETTGNKRWADVSAKLADYAISKMPSDYIPPWDYLLPPDEEPHKDTSAASITAAGLFLLSEFYRKNGEPSQAAKYDEMALNMLIALRDKHDLTNLSDAQGLLNHAATFVPKGIEHNRPNLINSMLPYGDYYYFEATLRALGHKNFFW